MTRSGTIPLDLIAWIKIYHAKHVTEKNMKRILAETGGDICFNGTIFSWANYKPLCPTRADGTTLCATNWKVYGLSWNGAEDFSEAVVADSKKNYISCVPLIISGKKKDKPNYQKDMGGSRPRTAIGVKEGRFAYFVTSNGYTPERLRDLLYSYGWSHATMLDGGGSTCFLDSTGKGFTCASNRTISHYIVIKYKDKEPKGTKPMVEINAYSKKTDGAKKLSTNFAVKEFACKDGSDAILVAPRLVMVLQSIRSYFGKPVVIHSAYRTPAYNTKVGGAAQSQHCYGTAADISIAGVTPAKIAAYARQLMPDWGGVGIYASQGFVHIDVRETKADWNG